MICAEGYVFELERRGYLQAGAFVPEVVLEHPEAVRQLHRDFVHAGSDVVEALTYYAHREKLRVIGREGDLERDQPCARSRSPRTSPSESGALFAGNICNTNVFDPADQASHKAVRAMFEEQVGWAVDAGVDFIIGETFSYAEEALIALESIKEAKQVGGDDACDAPVRRSRAKTGRSSTPASASPTLAPTSSDSTASADRRR